MHRKAEWLAVWSALHTKSKQKHQNYWGNVDTELNISSLLHTGSMLTKGPDPWLEKKKTTQKQQKLFLCYLWCFAVSQTSMGSNTKQLNVEKMKTSLMFCLILSSWVQLGSKLSFSRCAWWVRNHLLITDVHSVLHPLPELIWASGAVQKCLLTTLSAWFALFPPPQDLLNTQHFSFPPTA